MKERKKEGRNEKRKEEKTKEKENTDSCSKSEGYLCGHLWCGEGLQEFKF
jgi:hypothetical protein